MLINEQTKIAALLKHHPDALEAIIRLSPDFKKLRNPMLRKLMAGRTSISMASKIGGCTPEDFFKALEPLGFEVDVKGKLPIEDEDTIEHPIPEYLQSLPPERIIPLDVRSMLAEGNDPLRYIQQTIKGLAEGDALRLINTFEPAPLIALLEKQGFKSYITHTDKDIVETYFYKDAIAATPNTVKQSINENSEEQIPETLSGDWDKLLKHFENKLQEIDVRHLEMPMPMMTILESLEKLPDNAALYVHHKRIPVFLLTELKDRKFDYRIKEISSAEVFLLIFRAV